MNYDNKFDKQWQNEGTQPADTFFASTGGFKAKLKPPAQYFNWFWHKVIAAITELQTKLGNVDTNKANKTLDNVENATFKAKIESSGFKGGASNVKDGSKIGSVRTSGSKAEGSNYTIGNYAFAEGSDTQASGAFSHAEGYKTFTGGESAHAEGEKTRGDGNFSHAEGYDTMAEGSASHSEGWETYAGGKASHSEGIGTKAMSAEAQHVQGKYNVVDSNNEYAHIIGNGTSDTSRRNAHTVDWDGNAWYAGKVSTGADAVPLTRVMTFSCPQVTLNANGTADYYLTVDAQTITQMTMSPSDYIILRLRDGGTAGVTSLTATSSSGTSFYRYSSTGGYTVDFLNNGNVHIANTKASTVTINNLEFLIIEKSILTVI